MSDKADARRWPQYLIFLVTFTIAIVGLFGPRFWGDQNAVSDAALWVLLVISLAVALLPKVTDWFMAGTITNDVKGIAGLLGKTGTVGAQIETIASDVNAGGPLRKSLDELEKRLGGAEKSWTAIGDIETNLGRVAAQVDEIARQVVPADELRNALDAISGDTRALLQTSAKLDEITKRLDALSSLATQLDAIQAALPKKPDEEQ